MEAFGVNTLIVRNIAVLDAITVKPETVLLVTEGTGLSASEQINADSFERVCWVSKQSAPREVPAPVLQLRAPIHLRTLFRAFDRKEFIADYGHEDTSQLLKHSGEGTRILVAEDSRSNQFVVRSMLESVGYEVDVVSDGIEAYSALLSLPYDLVLMDVQMPEMNGLQATEQIRKLDGSAGEVPIIALTAKTFKEDVEECLARGMDDFISKPVQLEVLLQTIAKWTDRRDQQNESNAFYQPAAVEHLVSVVGAIKVRDMLKTFAAEMQERASTIAQAMNNNDWDTVRTESHTVKGASRAFGYVALSDTAERAEHYCQDNQALPDPALYAEFHALIDQALTHLTGQERHTGTAQ